MAYKFGDYIDELLASGYAYLGSNDAAGRAAKIINLGISRVEGADVWPFLRARLAGAAPLQAPRVTAVHGVQIDGRKAGFVRWLNGRDPDEAGAWEGYRFKGETIVAFPAPAAAAIVADVTQLSAPYADRNAAVAVPDQYFDVVMDAAKLIAAKEGRDWDSVAGLRGELKDGIERMRDELLDRDYTTSDYVAPYEGD